jgi:xanthine dehydrogenase accessory factor
MIVDSEGNSYGTIGGGGMERRLVSEALEVLKEGNSRTLTFALGVEAEEGTISVDSKCGGEVKIFMEIVKPDPKLIIIGSGHIGKPLATISHQAGFSTIVVDDTYTATRERFPFAIEILNGHFEEELKRIEVTPADFVAIVHGETRYELVALRNLLPKEPAYIGLLGSVNKARQHKKQLEDEGFSKKTLEKINAPIGLDIGAETPEEIAVSIVAELIRANRRSPLKSL